MTAEEESVRLRKPTKVIVDDLRFVHTQENIIFFYYLFYARKFFEILLKST